MIADLLDLLVSLHEFLDQFLVVAQACSGIQVKLLDWDFLVLEVVDLGVAYQYEAFLWLIGVCLKQLED